MFLFILRLVCLTVAAVDWLTSGSERFWIDEETNETWGRIILSFFSPGCSKKQREAFRDPVGAAVIETLERKDSEEAVRCSNSCEY